jgi:hypothetical protein
LTPLDHIERRMEELGTVPISPDGETGTVLATSPSELLALGEAVLEHWVAAKGLEPTTATREGFRLLALHRQGTTDDPSFNACRETCRELVYHYNLLTMDPPPEDAPRRLRMMALVANHLRLFVVGKLQVAGLGDFCCSSRPLHEGAARVEQA